MKLPVKLPTNTEQEENENYSCRQQFSSAGISLSAHLLSAYFHKIYSLFNLELGFLKQIWDIPKQFQSNVQCDCNHIVKLIFISTTK